MAGLDNVNSYHDPALKVARLAGLKAFHGFEEARVSLEDTGRVGALFEEFRPGSLHCDLRTRWRQDSLAEGKASTSPTNYGKGAAEWAS